MTVVTTGSQVCNRCGVRKSLTEFPTDSRRANGVRTICKYCRNTYRDFNRERNRAKRNASDSKPVARPPEPEPEPVPVLSPEEVLTQARSRALMQLVKRHRSEFDLLVAREISANNK